MERRLTAILAADVVGYSRLMSADEAGTFEGIRAVERTLIEPVVGRHAGRIVKRMGDGYIVEFQSVVAAVECALAWQSGATEPIAFRVGIELGDVIVENQDLYGDGLNIAVRLEGLADPGCICISEHAWRHARGKVDAQAEELGERTLKNIGAPVGVIRLRTGREDGPGEEAAQPAERGGYQPPGVLLSPCRALAATGEAELIASGLTENVASALAHFEEFTVVDPGAAAQVGGEAQAEYVLDGTVQAIGARARFVLQLVEAGSNRRVWSERLDRDIDDVFSLQDDITAYVASTMGDAVSAEQSRACAHKPDSELTRGTGARSSGPARQERRSTCSSGHSRPIPTFPITSSDICRRPISWRTVPMNGCP